MNLKNDKNCPFWQVFENPKLAVKQCYQTGHLQWDKNWWKMPKFKISNATFLVIFRQCGGVLDEMRPAKNSIQFNFGKWD